MTLNEVIRKQLIKSWRELTCSVREYPLDITLFKNCFKMSWKYFSHMVKIDALVTEDIDLMNKLNDFYFTIFGMDGAVADIADRNGLWGVYFFCGGLVKSLLDNLPNRESVHGECLYVETFNKTSVIFFDGFDIVFDDEVMRSRSED